MSVIAEKPIKTKKLSRKIAYNNAIGETIETKQKYLEIISSINQATKDEKIYRMVGPNFPRIKYELQKRGYIEKRRFCLESIYYQMPITVLMSQYKTNSKCEQALFSRLLGSCTPNFVWIWNPRLYNKFHDAPMLNKIKFKKGNFGVKNGLCKCVERINWMYHENFHGVNYPRSYNVIGNEELNEFLIDYKLTLACSIVLFLSNSEKLKNCFSKDDGSIYYGSLETALNIVFFYAGKQEGLVSNFDDIDLSDEKLSKLEKFHHSLVQGRQKILAGEDRTKKLIEKIKHATEEIRHYWPKRMSIDGYHNIWLLKPAFLVS